MASKQTNYIQKMRNEYPQYRDIDDVTLAKAYAKKHYGDMDEDTFLDKVGLHQKTTMEKIGDAFSSVTLFDKPTDAQIEEAKHPTLKAVDISKPLSQLTLPSDTDTIKLPTAPHNDDVTATRAFTMSKPTAKEEFENTFVPKMLSPVEQDEQISTANKAILTGTGDYVNPDAGDWELGKRVVNRTNELTGNAIQFSYGFLGNLKTPAEYLGITGDTYDETNKRQAKWFDDAANKLNDFVYEKNKLSVKPTHTWEETKKAFSTGGVFDKDAWQELGNYVGNEGVASIPDMAEMVAALPLYYAARRQESAEKRAQNEGRTVPNESDYLISAPTTIGSIMLDRFGLKAMTEDVVENIGKQALSGSLKEVAATITKEIKQGTLKEGTTEAIQNPLEQFGEEVGTKKGLSSGEAYLDTAIAGAVAGAGMGAGLSGSVAVGTEAVNSIKEHNQEKRDERIEKQYDALTQDMYNKAMLGGGREIQLDQAPAEGFASYVDEHIKSVQESLRNLKINHPEHIIPDEVHTDIDVANQTIKAAQEAGLNTSDNNGLNAIDTGFQALAQEIGGVDELQPFGVTPIGNTAKQEEAPVVPLAVPVQEIDPADTSLLAPSNQASGETTLPMSKAEFQRFQYLNAIPQDDMSIDERFELEDLTAKLTTQPTGENFARENEVPVVKESLTPRSDTLTPDVWATMSETDRTRLAIQAGYSDKDAAIVSAQNYTDPLDPNLEILSGAYAKDKTNAANVFDPNSYEAISAKIDAWEKPADTKEAFAKAIEDFGLADIDKDRNAPLSQRRLSHRLYSKFHEGEFWDNHYQTIEDSYKILENPERIKITGIDRSVSMSRRANILKENHAGQWAMVDVQPVMIELDRSRGAYSSGSENVKVYYENGYSETVSVGQIKEYKEAEDIAAKPTKAKKLNQRAEAIQAAGEIPVGGSEDTTKAAVVAAMNQKDQDSDYKKMGDKERTELEENEAISRGKEISQLEYERAYDYLPTDTKKNTGMQNSFGFEGTQNALFDTTSGEEYTIPQWAKGIVSDTTRYEEIITAITNAKNGDHSQLSTRVIDALRAAGSPHLEKEIARYDELITRWDLNPMEEQEQEALSQLLKNIIKDENYGNTTATTSTDSSDSQSTQGSDTVLQAAPSEGSHQGGGESNDYRPVSASLPVQIVFDTHKEYSTKGIKHETPSRVISKQIQKDVARYVTQLSKALGGWDVATDKKGKPLPFMGVSDNIPPAGGDATFKLFQPNSDIGIYVSLDYGYVHEDAQGNDVYSMGERGGLGQMYRITYKDKRNDGTNRWIKSSELTTKEFIGDIIKLVEREEGKNNESRGTATGGATADTANHPAGIPTEKQSPSNTGAKQGSDGAVPKRNQRPDGLGTPRSDQDGVSQGNEPVGGHQATDGNNAPKQGERADGDAVLPKPDERHSPAAYSLEGKAPVELTKGERKKYNAAALDILKKPLEEITEADREILRNYTGEGGLGEVNENTVNQHYTSYETVESIYNALKLADVPMNKVLEPAVGSGNFVGFMPNAKWDVVDIDTTNIEVVQRLYPQINNYYNESYETFQGKNYDLIVSNVPFASEQMLMREHAMTIKPAFKAIHNFYFAHSIDKVKDNGVVAFMTSTGTMDGTTTARSLRKYLMDRGDIIGAFRLPEKSQAKNAHTDTMIDIIFIQKRPDGVKSRQEALNNQFVNIGNKEGQPMNEYFIAHPENLLGDTVVIEKDKMKMGREGWVVKGEPKLENIKISYEPYKALPKAKADQTRFAEIADAVKYAKENSLEFKIIDKAHIEINDNSVKYFDVPVTFTETEAIGMFGKELRGENAQKTLLLNRIMTLTETGITNEDKGMMATALREIEAYKETYTKSPHNDLAFKKFMKDHRAELKLKEFMSYFDKDFNPAAVYEQQTRFKDSGKLSIDASSPVIDKAVYYANSDGVLATDKAYEFLSAKEIIALESNRDFIRLGANTLQLDFLYYAGNVYTKLDALELLKASNEINAEHYQEQYAKLKEITPKQIPFKSITVRGNESWLPDAIKNVLLNRMDQELTVNSHVFDGDFEKIKIYNRYLNKTALAPKGKDESDAENIERTMEAGRLLNETLIPMVMSYIEKHGLSEILTDEYNRQSNFYVRPEMSGRLLRELPKSFRGKPFTMQSHQRVGAEKLVYNKKGVLAFAPGGGKTITAIVATMNLIEQGVMKKPLFVVPVNTIAQWEASVRELYPNATVYEFPKVQSGKNKGNAKEWTQLSREEKEQMAYDLANNRYDFTIIGDTMFQKFGLPSHILSEYVDDLVDQIQAEEEASEEGDKKDLKAAVSAEAKKRALKRGLKQAYGGEVEFDFAKLGFDAIIADEVQYYKNIGFAGKDAKGGLGTSIAIKYFDKEGNSLTSKDIKAGNDPHSATLGSMRSYDFRFKSKYVSQNNNGNNVILLTGTPTPNAPLELYTLLQHLDENILREYGIETSSDFVDTFYDIESFETTDSTGAIVKRDGLSQMKNLDWMGKILDRFVDYKSFSDMPDLPRPQQVDVKHYLKLSKAGEIVFQDVQHRILTAIEDGKKVKAGNMLPEEVEIPLVAMGAGRSASIDLRLYDVGKKGKSTLDQESLYDLIESDIATTENNKILKTIELVSNQYKENSNSGQIIFLDRLTVKNREGGETSTHKEMRDKILATGLFEENEVIFVNGSSFVNPTTGTVSKGSIKPDMLNRIMDMYNEGKIKVIIGNTAKLGVGVDLNRKTTDIYQLDIPYRPDEIEQRSNRGVRQGNENAQVRVHQFFQLGTFDKRSYQIVINKRGFNDMYGFSDNNDLIVEDGVSKIDNSNVTDPYQAIIDLESNPYERERLRKQRTIDNSATDEINIKRLISKLEGDIKTKQGSLKNYADAIINIDSQLEPRNYPKYEAIKDETEKKEKLDKHIDGLKERKTKYTGNIAELETVIQEIEIKLEDRKDQLAQQAADKKFITDEFTNDGKNVSIVKIKEALSIEQILKSEGATDKEIAQYLAEEGDVTPKTSYYRHPSQKITPNVQTKEDSVNQHYNRSQGYDDAGVNFVPTYKVLGLPARSSDGFITIGTDRVALPSVEKPMNADSLRVYVSDIIGSRLYDGKIKGNKNIGAYKHKDSSIRLKSFSDMETLSHELAHYLDYFHKNSTKKATGSFFRKEIMKNKEEIKALSYTANPDEAINEGFAEFIRLYLTNYNTVAQLAPNMMSDFEARLGDDLELKKKMVTLRNGMHQYFYQGANVRNYIGGELDSTAKKIKRSQKEIGSDTRQKLVDRIHSIKRIEGELRGDVANDAMDSPYKALQLVNGHSSIMHTAMNLGVPTLKANGDITYSGKSINAIFSPVTSVSEERVRLLEDYLVAKRSSELMEQGRENLIPQEAITAGLKLAEQYPEFETIFKEYQTFNRAMLDFYVGMNHITEGQRESFLEMNQNYVPFHRVMESVQNGGVSAGAIGKRLTGGTHSLGNIMENIIDGLESNIKEALISRGKSMFYDMVERSGTGGVYATRIATDDKKVKVDFEAQVKNVAQVMADLGITLSKDGMIMTAGVVGDQVIDIKEIEQNLLDNPKTLEFFTHGHPPVSKSGYIDSTIIDGQKVYFETNDAGLIDAMTSFNSYDYGLAVTGLMNVKNVMTWNITNNPLFYISNFTRDTVSAGVLSKNGFIPVLTSVKGMYHFIAQSKVYKDFMASGAGYGTMRTTAGSDIQAMRMLNVNRGFDVFNKIISGLGYAADVFEYGTRIGEFELAQRAGKSNWQSAFEGREISTDFAIKGSSRAVTGFMGTVPFMKAAVNGIDKTARRIFSLNGEMKLSNAVKFRNAQGELQKHKVWFYATGGMIIAGTLALWFQNRDDERYKRLTRDQKLMYWHIFVGDKHIKIPRPYDIGFLFATLPEIIVDGIYTKHGADAADNFMFGMKSMFMIGDISGLFQPIGDHLMNTNWMGSPIIPTQLQNVDDKSDQYTERTALLYKNVGKATGMSPILMQHYVDGYLGLTAKMIEEGAENILWDTKAWGARPFAQNPIEFLTYRFTGKKEDSRTAWSEKYYDLSNKAKEVKASYDMKYNKAFIDNGKEVMQYASDEKVQAYLAIDEIMGSINSDLSDMKVQLEQVTYSKQYTKEQKEQIINDAYKAKREGLEKVVTELEQNIKELEGDK